MKILLPKLTEKLQHFHSKASQIPVPAFIKQLPSEDSAVISHLWFWPRVSYFFKPKDVIVTETGWCCSSFVPPYFIYIPGTSNFGILDVPLPTGTILINQILFGSIGWSVGKSFRLLSFDSFSKIIKIKHRELSWCCVGCSRPQITQSNIICR